MYTGTIIMLGFVLCLFGLSGFLLYKNVTLAGKRAQLETDESGK